MAVWLATVDPSERPGGATAAPHGVCWVEVRNARMTTAERKADTRHKIQLGGLIVKAGLAAEEPAVLLGRLTAGAAAEVGEWRGGFGSARRTPHARVQLGDLRLDLLNSSAGNALLDRDWVSPTNNRAGAAP